jgi:predicted heme/steroid binding protein
MLSHERRVPCRLILLAVALLMLPGVRSLALPDFAAETGLTCGECHEGGADGGPLTRFGEDYLNAGHVLPGGTNEQSPSQSVAWLWLRGLVRFIHLAVGVVWFGAIAYIHLFTGPRRLTKGLPKAEMRLGWFSIAVMAITGTLLSIWKLGSLDELWTTAFGAVWQVKVGAFLALVIIAAVATTSLNRRMKKAAAEVGGPGACGLVRFAYDGKLYDATESKWWEGGTHAGRHRAGTDLTDALAEAPHGPEVLDRVKLVGPAARGHQDDLPGAAKAFIVLAYVNLVLIAIVLFCASFWGWGLALLG